MLLGTLGASLLGNLWTGKRTIRPGEGTFTTGEGQLEQGKFLIPPHPLTNFERQKYYQNEPKFNRFYSRNYLPKIKDEVYVINLDEYESIGTHWIVLYVNNNNLTYFDSFGVEHMK